MKKKLLICSFPITLGLLLAISVFRFGSAQQVYAATTGVNRYVSNTGSDIPGCTNPALPCQTIQYAINQSGFGDNIQVAIGIYNEHITMKDGVSIYGKGWDNTVIHGGYSGGISTVDIPTSVSASTVLSGVKVTGGGWGFPGANPNGGGLRVYGSPSIVNTWVYSCTGYKGGGVYVNGGSPTFNNVPVWNSWADYGGGFYIENNAVVNIYGNPLEGTNGTVWWNSSGYSGGGFYLGEATVTMIGLRIYWNTSEEGGGLFIGENPNKVILWLNDISGNRSTYWGGGMRVWKASNLDFFGNFIGNSFVGGNRSSGDGAGVSFLQSGGSVHNNWFLGNVSESGYGGAASFCYASPNLILRGNWFEKNSALQDGGALALYSGADPQIDANTIVSNTARLGGGMDISEAGYVQVTNNIIARNNSTSASTAVGGVHVFKSPAQIVNNTIADNAGDGVLFAQSDYISIINNILYGNSDDSVQGDISSGTTYWLVDFNDKYANAYNAYFGVPPGPNDLNINPQFKASGDIFKYYHLMLGSPVNTTGILSWAPAHDIDNQLRNCGGKVSMGSDQLACPLYLPMLNR